MVTFHVVSRKGGWAVKKEGASKALKAFQTKAAAVKFCEQIRKVSERVVIHDRKGAVERLLNPEKDKIICFLNEMRNAVERLVGFSGRPDVMTDNCRRVSCAVANLLRIRYPGVKIASGNFRLGKKFSVSGTIEGMLRYRKEFLDGEAPHTWVVLTEMNLIVDICACQFYSGEKKQQNRVVVTETNDVRYRFVEWE